MLQENTVRHMHFTLHLFENCPLNYVILYSIHLQPYLNFSIQVNWNGKWWFIFYLFIFEMSNLQNILQFTLKISVWFFFYVCWYWTSMLKLISFGWQSAMIQSPSWSRLALFPICCNIIWNQQVPFDQSVWFYWVGRL